MLGPDPLGPRGSPDAVPVGGGDWPLGSGPAALTALLCALMEPALSCPLFPRCSFSFLGAQHLCCPCSGCFGVSITKPSPR